MGQQGQDGVLDLHDNSRVFHSGAPSRFLGPIPLPVLGGATLREGSFPNGVRRIRPKGRLFVQTAAICGDPVKGGARKP